MLGTLPLQAAYLQQLLHICQALQLQPSHYASSNPSPNSTPQASRAYSNPNIEAINSALAAQQSNPACGRTAVPAAAAAASAHTAAALQSGMPLDSAAAAQAASQHSTYDRSSRLATAHRQMADMDERSVVELAEHMRSASLYQSLDQRSCSVPASPHSQLHSPFCRGLAHMSQTQPTQGFAQSAPTLGGMHADQHGLLHTGAAGHMNTPDECGPHLLSRWDQTRQGRADEHKPQQHGPEGWAGQNQTGRKDAPLNAAEYDAVMNLQSLALQLQATGEQQNCNCYALLIFLDLFALHAKAAILCSKSPLTLPSCRSITAYAMIIQGAISVSSLTVQCLAGLQQCQQQQGQQHPHQVSLGQTARYPSVHHGMPFDAAAAATLSQTHADNRSAVIN